MSRAENEMREQRADDNTIPNGPDPEAHAFTRRLSEAYAPEPLSAAQRARFDADLEERLERRRRRGGLLPLVAGAAAAAALAWVLLPAGTPQTQTRDPAVAGAGSAAQWEYDLIYASDGALAGGSEESDALPDGMLPADYAAIDSLLLGG